MQAVTTIGLDIAKSVFQVNGDSGAFSLQKHKGWTCSYDKANTADRLLTCLTEQAEAQNVLVIGDSVGRDTMHALRLAVPDRSFLMLHQSSCPPVEFANENGKKCFDGMNGLLEKLAERVNVEVVVLAFRYKPPKYLRVEAGLDKLKQLFGRVVLLGAAPMWKRSVPEFVASAKELPEDINLGDSSMVRSDYSNITDEARRIAQAHLVTFVNVYPFYCGAKSCRLWIDDDHLKTLLWDQEHLTPDGMRLYGNFLATQPGLEGALLHQ